MSDYMNILWARTPEIAAAAYEHACDCAEDYPGFLVCFD